MNEYHCPRCGRLTTGAWSEGGVKWAICEDCMAEEQCQNRKEREKRKEQNRERT